MQSSTRSIVHRTRGSSHGPVTRLVSPSDVGQLIKPFVFLDYFDIDPTRSPHTAFHPHSGIATITLLLEGRISYEDTAGAKGVIEPGGVEWMRAAGGVWHTGGPIGNEPVRGFQLWIALPPELESSEAEGSYFRAEQFQTYVQARVILGGYGDVVSQISAPPTINYLDVSLAKGEQWSYHPPDNHDVAWVAVHKGRVATPAVVMKGEFAAFNESSDAIEFRALDDSGFVLGSAVKHPYDLVLGNYSVHTSTDALAKGEARISAIRKRLSSEGRL